MPSDDGRSSPGEDTDDKTNVRPESAPIQPGTQAQDEFGLDVNRNDSRLFGGFHPHPESEALVAVSNGAALTSPRGRVHLLTSPRGAHSSPLDLTQRQIAWLNIFDRIRNERAYQDLNVLDNLNHQVQHSNNFAMDMQPLVQVTENGMAALRDVLQDSGLNLSEETQKRVLAEVTSMTKEMQDSVQIIFDQEASSMSSVSESLCNIIGYRPRSGRNSVSEGALDMPLPNIQNLSVDHMMQLSKPKLAQLFDTYKRGTEAQMDEHRNDIDRNEAKIASLERDRDRAEEELRQEKSSTSKRVRKEVNDRIEALQNWSVEESGSPVYRRRPNPIRTETQASDVSQPSGTPEAFPPHAFTPRNVRQNSFTQNEDDPFITTGTTASETEIPQRKDFQETLRGILLATDAVIGMKGLTRQFVQQNVGLGSSGPPSARSPLTLTSSSSTRTTPIRPSAAGSAGQVPRPGQHMLIDELGTDDVASTPQTGTGARPSSDLGLPTHGNPTLPGQNQQVTGVDQGFFEDHELQEDEIGKPTPSTLTLNILARFIERSILAPSRISDMVEKLVQIGKINRESELYQSFKRLIETASQVQNEKPTALTELQLEQAGPQQDIEDWIADAEPYLDRFTKLLVDRAEEVTRAADRWQRLHPEAGSVDDEDKGCGVGARSSGKTPAYQDPDWLKYHRNGPCPDCVPILTFMEGCSAPGEDTDTTQDDEESEEEDEKERGLTSTGSQLYASTRPSFASARASFASRSSTSTSTSSGANNRHVQFNVSSHHPKNTNIGPRSSDQRSLQRRARPPAPLDLSRAGREARDDTAGWQPTPHPSTIRSSVESTSTTSFRTPTSQTARYLSPMPEAPNQKVTSARAVVGPTTVPATQTSPSMSSPEMLSLRGGLSDEGRPHVYEYVCKTMAGKKPGRPRRPVAKEPGTSQQERFKNDEQQMPVGDKAQDSRTEQTNLGEQTTNTPPANEVGQIEASRSDKAGQKGARGQVEDRQSEPQPAPALWRQILMLLYSLIRWLTWGQLVNLWIVSTFILSLLKYFWDFLQHELASGMLTPDLRRRSLRPLQSPKIPGAALSSLWLWLLVAWSTAMLVSMKEERRLWLAANPRTASYLRGLSSRHPYPWWSPLEVDYAFLEPAWNGFSMWLYEAYLRVGISALAGAFYKGHAPVVLRSALSDLAYHTRMALVQVGIEDRQDMLHVM